MNRLLRKVLLPILRPITHSNYTLLSRWPDACATDVRFERKDMERQEQVDMEKINTEEDNDVDQTNTNAQYKVSF